MLAAIYMTKSFSGILKALYTGGDQNASVSCLGLIIKTDMKAIWLYFWPDVKTEHYYITNRLRKLTVSQKKQYHHDNMLRRWQINYENWQFSEWDWKCVNFLWQVTILILRGVRVIHCERVATTLTLTEKTVIRPNCRLDIPQFRKGKGGSLQ